ncbi:MAG: hypothetical protein MJ002_00195 [Paludibacteraceae bacterium]|nr:hypothetical protein [Paludibacteraceae bacterium]
MKKYLFILAILALAIIPSCSKDDDDNKDTPTPPGPTENAPNAKFLGKYTLFIEYVTECDDEDVSSTSGAYSGSMEIVADGDTNVIVTGNIDMSGSTVDIFNTTGQVLADGRLELNPNYLTTPSGLDLMLSYAAFRYAEPLVFSAFMYVEMQGYGITYNMTVEGYKE